MSDTRDEKTDQPLPRKGDGRWVHHEVIYDFYWSERNVLPVTRELRKRLEMGVSKYGRALEPHNGRSPLRDAYEEALDLCCYLKQASMENRFRGRLAQLRYRWHYRQARKVALFLNETMEAGCEG